MEGGNAVISRREQFRQVSTAWHRFLKFGSAHDNSGVGLGNGNGNGNGQQVSGVGNGS